MSPILFSLGCSAVAIVVALALIWKISRAPGGDPKMQEIAHAIQIGAKAYLNRQYKTVALVAVVVAVLIGVFLGWTTMAGFVIGAFASALAGYIGMNMSVRANVKTAEAAKVEKSQRKSFADKASAVGKESPPGEDCLARGNGIKKGRESRCTLPLPVL